MKIYISGPITGLPHSQVYTTFKSWTERLKQDGHEPVNPLEIALGYNHSWEWCMKQDLKALLDCDAILLLDGWSASRGATLEEHVAEEVGLFILNETTYEEAYGALSRR